MPQVNHILVSVEIHENAAPVVAWAVLIARAMHSRLTLLHVDESLEPLKHKPVVIGRKIPGTDVTPDEWRSSYPQAARLELARLV